jgi:hypothetical protein
MFYWNMKTKINNERVVFNEKSQNITQQHRITGKIHSRTPNKNRRGERTDG